MVLFLDTHSEEDFFDFGEELFNRYRVNFGSFEKVAQFIVNEIYSSVFDENGNNIFALLRIFRFGTYDSLEPALQAHISSTDENIPYWLTLMGTYGDKPQWRYRAFSDGHQVFPAQTDFTPMLQEVFNQMVLNPGDALTEDDVSLMFNRNLPYKRRFWIEQALHSEHIPAQDEFVIPYNIQSVIGFGGLFVNQSGFICIAFTKVPINQVQLDKIMKIAPAVANILGLYESRDEIWE